VQMPLEEETAFLETLPVGFEAKKEGIFCVL
jgi:hypothetical protein